jgi:signal transduction histidine kinase
VARADPGERGRERIDRLQDEVAALRRSRRRLVEAAEADRREIERAVHDGVQQDLVALAIDLRRLSGLLDGDPASAKALLASLEARVRAALEDVGSLAQGIHPPLLGERGLASALRAVAQRGELTLTLDIPAPASYPLEVTAAIYWTCVEILSVAPPGSHAAVSLRALDGSLEFEVTVSGALADGRVEHVRDRIEAVDGRITAERLASGGSRVHGSIPLVP